MELFPQHVEEKEENPHRRIPTNVKFIDEHPSCELIVVWLLDHSGSMTAFNRVPNMHSNIKELDIESKKHEIRVLLAAYGENNIWDSRNMANGKKVCGFPCDEYLARMSLNKDYTGGTYLKSVGTTLDAICKAHPKAKIAMGVFGDGEFDGGMPEWIDLTNKMMEDKLMDRIVAFTFTGAIKLDPRIRAKLQETLPVVTEMLKHKLVRVVPFEDAGESNVSLMWNTTHRMMNAAAYDFPPNWVGCCSISWDSSTAEARDIVDFILAQPEYVETPSSKVVNTGGVISSAVKVAKSVMSMTNPAMNVMNNVLDCVDGGPDAAAQIQAPQRKSRKELVQELQKFLEDVIKSSPNSLNDEKSGYAKLYTSLIILEKKGLGTISEFVSTLANQSNQQNVKKMISAAHSDNTFVNKHLPMIKDLSIQYLSFTMPKQLTRDMWELAIKDEMGVQMYNFMRILMLEGKPTISESPVGLPLVELDRTTGGAAAGEYKTIPPANACLWNMRMFPLALGFDGYLAGNAFARLAMVILTRLEESISALRERLEIALFEGGRDFLNGILGITSGGPPGGSESTQPLVYLNSTLAEIRYRFFKIYWSRLSEGREQQIRAYFDTFVEPTHRCLQAHDAVYHLSIDSKQLPQIETTLVAIEKECIGIVKHEMFKELEKVDPMPRLPYVCWVKAVDRQRCTVVYLDEMYEDTHNVLSKESGCYRGIPVVKPFTKKVNNKFVEPLTAGGVAQDSKLYKELNYETARRRHSPAFEIKNDDAGVVAGAYDNALARIKQIIETHGRPPTTKVVQQRNITHVDIRDIIVERSKKYAFLSHIDSSAIAALPKATIVNMMIDSYRASPHSKEADNTDNGTGIGADILRLFKARIAPEIIQAPLVHKECVVCGEFREKTDRVPIACGHAMCDKCYDGQIISCEYKPCAFFKPGQHKCPLCRMIITQKHRAMPRAIELLIAEPALIDDSVVYRICEIADCPNKAFAAGSRECSAAGDDDHKDDVHLTKCPDHSVATSFPCPNPNCRTPLQHNLGCNAMRCCPRGHDRCPAARGEHCDHKICNHVHACKCWRGCGTTFRISNELRGIGNGGFVGNVSDHIYRVVIPD